MSVICVCLSPGFQRSVIIDSLIPGEVNRLKSVTVDAAGKGMNVCRMLQRLGIDAFCLAQGGSNADELMSLARLEGLDLRFIPSSGRLRTCTSLVETAMVTGSRVTELAEPSYPVDESGVNTMTQAVQAMLPSATVLAIAGSMAPGHPAGYPARLASMARQSGVPVLLDVRGSVLLEALASRPAVVKINLAEFAATFLARRFSGGEHNGVLAEALASADIMNAVSEVSRDHAKCFVLTRGAESILLARDGEVRSKPVPALAAEQIINPIGSGDAFLAGMLAQLLTSCSKPSWLTKPVQLADPLLRQHFLQHIQEMRQYAKQDFRDKVHQSLMWLIEAQRFTTNELAQHFSSRKSPMSHRLKEAGTSFRELHREARHTTARQRLSDTKSSIKAIATLLGYSDATAFNRAFSQWEGVSAAKWRRQMRTAHSQGVRAMV